MFNLKEENCLKEVCGHHQRIPPEENVCFLIGWRENDEKSKLHVIKSDNRPHKIPPRVIERKRIKVVQLK